MQTGSFIGGMAWSAAQNILNSLIGDVLGWVIVLALLSPFLLILYVVLKKSRWRDLHYDPRSRKVIVRAAFGSPQKVEEQLLAQLANPGPGAHSETMKLDLSDPQAQAKVAQFLQGIGALDPEGKAKLEEAMRTAEAAGAKANFTVYTSKVVSVTGPAAASELMPAAGSSAPPEPGPTILDGAAVPTPPPAPGLGPATHGPTLLGGAPDWHEGLQEKWQRERDETAHADHAAFTQGLDRNRAALRALIRPVRYAITGLCGLAVAACLLKGRAHNEYNILRWC